MNRYITYSHIDEDIGYTQYFNVTFLGSVGLWAHGEKITCLSVNLNEMTLTEYDSDGGEVKEYNYRII